jgi:hypothetical protein
MLRITVEQRDATWVMKLEGRLQGEWVGELRRSWRGIRDVAAPASIRVELADIQFMDAAGKVLLKEMHREGVEITGRGFLASAICEEVTGSADNSRNASGR